MEQYSISPFRWRRQHTMSKYQILVVEDDAPVRNLITTH